MSSWSHWRAADWGNMGTCHSRSLHVCVCVPSSPPCHALLTPGRLPRHGGTLRPDPAGLSLTWRRRTPPGTSPELFPPPTRCRRLQPAASAGSRFTTTPSSFTVKLTAESKQEKKPARFLRPLSLNLPFFSPPPLNKSLPGLPLISPAPHRSFWWREHPVPDGPSRAETPPARARQIYTGFKT